MNKPVDLGEARRRKTKPPVPAREGLPVVRLSTDEPAIIREVIAGLAERCDVYQRCGALVETVRLARAQAWLKSSGEVPTIRALPPALVREEVCRCCAFERFDSRSGDWVPTHPPAWLVQAIHARAVWDGIRPLEAVTETPVLRPDFSVLDAPGYDSATGYLYCPRREYPPIPELPTQEQAMAAAREILEYVQDFPFASEAHRAAWLTIPLTIVARPAIDGFVPLTLLGANTPGAGKSLLADLAAIIGTGRDIPRMPNAQDDAEMRKRITSLVMAGEPVVLIDNVVGELGTQSLEAALTGEEWADRVLGASERIKAPMRIVWLASANNCTLHSDMLRRTLNVRLESPEEHPENRSGFSHELPGDAVREHPKLLVAALTMLRAHAVAGHPCDGLSHWGSFESWSRVVRGAVVFAGLPDPAETRQDLLEGADLLGSNMRALLDALEPHALYPKRIKAAELAKRLADDAELKSTLDELIDGPVMGRSIGDLFRRYRGRIFGGRAIIVAQESKGHCLKWTVQAVAQGAP